MSKLWYVEIKREIEESFHYHVEQDNEPTEEEIYKTLREEYEIADDPEYSRLIVYQVDETSDKTTGQTFYAVKFKDGTYLTRQTSLAPSLYTTQGRARGWADSRYSPTDGREYDIVEFREVK